MIKLFISNRSIVQFLLPFVIVIYIVLNFVSNYYSFTENADFGFWGDKVYVQPVYSQIFASLLVLGNAVGINAIFNWNQFLERNSFMPSLLYVVLLSFYHSFYEVDGLIISHLFIILMIHQLYFLRPNEDGRKYVFNAAFFAGLAASFHPPLIGFLPVIFFMIWTVRPFVFREIILCIVGFSAPLLYAGFYLIYTDTSINLKLLKTTTNYDQQIFDFVVTFTLFVFSLFLSIISIQSHIQKSSLRLKKMSRILWWIVFTGLVIGIIDFLVFKQIQRFSLIMIPFSFFLTFSFSHKTLGAVANILFYTTFIYSCLKFFLQF